MRVVFHACKIELAMRRGIYCELINIKGIVCKRQFPHAGNNFETDSRYSVKHSYGL